MLLIKKALQKLYKVKYYSNFDIIVVFNKIRIYFDNKHKIAFITCYSLFEYIIMFFGLCNILITFQVFINNILSSYLNDFCTIYTNNILIYNNIEEEHKDYVNKIFAKLNKVELYLDIKKCIFFVK